MNDSPELKVGDIVRLKSGGPAMTISVIEEGEALVNWFDRGKVNSHTFFLAELISLPVKELTEEQLSAMVLKT